MGYSEIQPFKVLISHSQLGKYLDEEAGKVQAYYLSIIKSFILFL